MFHSVTIETLGADRFSVTLKPAAGRRLGAKQTRQVWETLAKLGRVSRIERHGKPYAGELIGSAGIELCDVRGDCLFLLLEAVRMSLLDTGPLVVQCNVTADLPRIGDFR